MTTDRMMQESSGMADEATDEVARDTSDVFRNWIIEASGGNFYTIPGSGHLSPTPVYVWMGQDPNLIERMGEFLSKPVALDAGAAGQPKTYGDVLAELRRATGIDIMPVKRFDPAEVSNMVVENARAVVKNALAELFPDDLTFDPIDVEIRTDQDDDEYLNIHIVFEGASEQITPALSGGLIRHIRPQLAELGFPGVPCWSFVEKSEWVKYFQSKRDGPAGTD